MSSYGYFPDRIFSPPVLYDICVPATHARPTFSSSAPTQVNTAASPRATGKNAPCFFMRNPVKKYGVNLKTRCSARYSPIAAYPTRSASATWNRIGARISSANCRHARICNNAIRYHKLPNGYANVQSLPHEFHFPAAGSIME